ncbi:MAG: hypothetical protein Q9162_007355 [Coniocarpon cinnabarinum]
MDRSYTYAGGGYHQREGFPTSGAADQGRGTPLLYVPQSKWQYAFSGVSLFQTVIALILEGYLFARFQADLFPSARDKPVSRVVATYLSLFIFGFLYQLVLVYDALRLKNTIQVIGLCIYNLGLVIEAAVQYDQIRDAFTHYSHPANNPRRRDGVADSSDDINSSFWDQAQPIAIAAPVFLGVVTLALAFLAWKLYDEFAWSIYKHISADLRLRRRYLSYQIYIALLKFDFFFFLAFTVQFLVIIPRDSASENVEFGLTVAAIPVTIVLLFLAGFWTRRESIWGMLLIIVVYFGALAYFCFKLFRMYYSNKAKEYYPARHSLTTFAVLTIALLIVTIAYATMVTLNFNKGLKPHIMTERQKRKRAGSGDIDKLVQGGNDVALGAAGPSSRMTID